MKNGRTLSELALEIERRAQMKRDFIVSTEAAEMTPDGHLRFADIDTVCNDLAHSQIGEHLEIPKKYYDKMKAEAPALLANNVNEWFKKYPAKRMVRTLGDTARAFLSDKYRPLENEELAQAILPTLLENDLDVMSCDITDRRLYIKAVNKTVTRELAKAGARFGDGSHVIVRCLSPAVTISNSEVGYGALSILAGTYDSFCSNLATFGERSMRKYHVGGRHEIGGEEIYAMLTDETRRKTDAAIWAQTRDVVKAALDRAKFDGLVDKIEGTRNERIEDAVQVIKLSSQRFAFNEDEGKSILRHLIEGADLSRFGLSSAITRASQDLADYDRASEFERIGGKVIELPKNEWTELAKAA